MIKLVSGKYKHLGKDKEYAIWRILQGEQQATAQQEAFVKQVVDVRLDWTAKDCPESYKLHSQGVRGVETNFAAVMGVTK